MQWVPERHAVGREDDHLSKFSGEIKNLWSFTSTTLYALMKCKKQEGSVHFTLW